MERLIHALGFVGKLAPALVLVGLLVVASDEWRGAVVAAVIVVGGFVGWHVFRAHMSGDDDVWDPVSTRSFELPLPRAAAAAACADALSAREDADDVHASAFTVTAVVERSKTMGIGGSAITATVHDAHGGGSRVVLEVIPAGGPYAEGPLDFGRTHRIASSIERDIRTAAARLASGPRDAEPTPRG